MQVKTKFLFILVVLTTFMLFGCAGNGGTNEVGGTSEGGGKSDSSEKPIVLTLNNWLPATHDFNTKIFEPWSKLVESETDGRVQIQIHNGAVLGGNTSVVQDVGGGKYDLGLAPFAYYYDTPYFLGTWSSLPFAISKPSTGTKLLEDFLNKFALDEINTDNVKYTGALNVTDPYIIFSKKPIHSFEDLQGLNLRIPGPHWTEIVKKWGANPVSLELGDTYEGILRGTLDAVIYSVTGAISYKFYEVAPYIVDLPLFSNSSVMLMNKHAYDSMPDDLKTLFDEELFPKITDLFNENYEKSIAKAWEEYPKLIEGKGEIIKLSEEDIELIKKPTVDAWENWISDAKERGYEGEKMIDYITTKIEEAGGVSPY